MKGRRLHFVGIGGAGMSGLALVCHRRGARVSGSDRAESSYTERLRAAGIEPRIGHAAEAVPEDAELVVSTAIGEDNPELALARERGQRVVHRGELLAELCSERRLIAVAGAHGKTTTAAMVAHALRAIGWDPPFLLGGELPGAGEGGAAANAGWGEGEWAVAEADESDASFLALSPEVAVVTNVELDHHARWGSLAELREAYARFCEPAEALALGPGAEVEPGDGRERRVLRLAAEAAPIELAVPGLHNQANARAALAAIELAGGDSEAARVALASFPGVARRLELRGRTPSGALVYDDYAHHPTEVRATLEAARELGPRRLIAIFQPHLYSRTRALAPEFGAALAAADEVAVLEVYPAREQPVGELAGVSGLDVARAAAERSQGRPVWWLGDAERAALALAPRLGEGDLAITIGAGDIHELAGRLLAGVQEA